MTSAPGLVRKSRVRSDYLLVVEDNPINQVVMQSILNKLGFLRVDEAPDGAAAIEAVTAGHYDLVLMDCQMPKIDGYEATRRLRESGVRIPIVAMTAHAMTGDRKKCILNPEWMTI